MRLMYHDLEEAALRELLPDLPEDIRTVTAKAGEIHRCIGCFGCWIKTPEECVIKDGYQTLGKLICDSDSLILITKVTYGGYSVPVKNLMDRSIGCLLPYFTMRNGEMHHITRYEQPIGLHVIGYGSIDQEERDTFQKIVNANALNFNAKKIQVDFIDSVNELAQLKGVL